MPVPAGINRPTMTFRITSYNVCYTKLLRGDLLRVDEDTWRRAWDLKVFGYINLSRQVYARMKARRSGVIVNVVGSAGEKMNAAYITGSIV